MALPMVYTLFSSHPVHLTTLLFLSHAEGDFSIIFSESQTHLLNLVYWIIDSVQVSEYAFVGVASDPWLQPV